jgi:hypothetical protein
MKNIAILAVIFLVPIESLLAATEPAISGVPIPSPVLRQSFKNTEIPADRQGSISIVAARWGAYNGWVDVTERVRVFARDGRLVIPHVPDSLGQLRDPAFGHHKALVVVYRQGQGTRLVIVPSQGRLELPEPASAVTGPRPNVNAVENIVLRPAAKSLKRPVFESVLGVYGQAIRGQRFPFVNLRPPDRNLWTEEIENKLHGTLSYGQVDYIGTAKLVIPETGTYTIDLPERGTQLQLNGIVLKLGDIQLQKGVYDVEIYTNHWGQPYLKYAHANVFKQGTRTRIPFVNTAAAIEDFRSQTIDSRKVIEVCNYPVKRVRVVSREPGSMLRFAGNGSVVIPRFRYDGSYPITLEALVQAPYRGTIVGSFDGSGLNEKGFPPGQQSRNILDSRRGMIISDPDGVLPARDARSDGLKSP